MPHRRDNERKDMNPTNQNRGEQIGEQIYAETHPLSARLKNDVQLMLAAADKIERLHSRLTSLEAVCGEIKDILGKAICHDHGMAAETLAWLVRDYYERLKTLCPPSRRPHER
jgi:hypothetical protein